MKCVVTGCAGFIGSHLTEALLEDGHSVMGIDCFNDNYGRSQKLQNLANARDWDGFDFVPIDLGRGALEDLVEQCDVVFHLAAEPGVRSSWGERFELYLRNNVLATQHLLESARRWPEKRIVYASSSSVYGQAEALPTPEDVTPKPFSPYGVTKLDAENLCNLYHANYGVNCVSLRYFSVYGPRQRPDMAAHRFIEALLDGRPVTLFGDGSQLRDFTYVDDVVDATIRALFADLPPGAVLDVASGRPVSVLDLVHWLRDLVGSPQVQVDRAPERHGDVPQTHGSIGATEQHLGWHPRTDLRSGLQRQVGWHRMRRAGETPSQRESRDQVPVLRAAGA